MSLGGPVASLLFPVLCFAVILPVINGFSLANIIVKPIVQTARFLYQMISSLPSVFTHGDQLSGIVGIVAQGGNLVGTSLLNAFQFAAFISLNLALLNLLPVPALDGGKILLYLLEKMNPKLQRLHLPLAIAGWVFIIGLMVYVTMLDIGKLLGGHAGL